MMKVFQLVTTVDPESGGPSYTVPAVCSRLHELGTEVELNVLGSIDPSNYSYNVVSHKRSFPARLGRSPELYNHLISTAKKSDILHTNGLWMMPNIYPYKIAKSTGSKIVLSPHGMLTKWSLNRNRFVKNIVGMLGQNNVISNSNCIHVTAESEYEDVRSYGFKGPVAIVPNGVDLPDDVAVKKSSSKDLKKIVFISRVHPKKGIELLIDVWANISKEYDGWELLICGPGDYDYIEKIKSLISQSASSRISYVEPVYGKEKDDFYNNSDIFVLPTHSENFGVVVAEALSYKVPVIVTKGAPWGGVVDNKCGWWVDISVDAIQSALIEALNTPSDELKKMGANGRQWMKAEFSWDKIGYNMNSMYKWLNGEIEKPSFIILD